MSYDHATRIEFDLASVPFSRCGSYAAFSLLRGEPYSTRGIPDGIWMRCVHGDVSNYEALLFEPIVEGTPVPYEVTTSASVLTLVSTAGKVEICIPTPSVIRIRARGVDLRITARCHRNHSAVPEPDGNWVFNMAAGLFRSYRLVPISGSLTVDAPWAIKRCERMIAELSPSADGVAEMAIEEFTSAKQVQDHSDSFDTLAKAVQSEFDAYSKPFLDVPPALMEAAKLATYTQFSAVVEPNGLITRPAMYMSKNHMTNVWAWDHAFNAMAISMTDPDLAWDQMMVIFDHQNEEGQIPDFINDVKKLYTFVKPPIHGWILRRMIQYGGPLASERLEQAYDMLSRWTDWWFAHRDPDGDGLPVYWHGNDSGWDNATVFDIPFPVKSPDLAAFLITQMDALAHFADELGRSDEAKEWRRRADQTLNTLINSLWDGSRFRAISTVTREAAKGSDSVFTCLPIILGKRLPTEIRTALSNEIKRHLTDWGPATENVGSGKHDPDGYWRGPIWAPSTMILIDGLNAAGDVDLANDVASRFCRLCAKSGFAENFNAVSGEALRDKAYTWTSSVFLVLANNYRLAV